MKRTLLIISLVAVGAANVFGTDLWNQQQTIDANVAGIINDNFTDSGNLVNAAANASYFTASQNWTIDSIDLQVFAPSGNIANGATFSAFLNLFPATGSLPTAGNNPLAGTAVTVTMTQNTGSGLSSYYDMKVSGLNMSVLAGNYWLNLTPSSSFVTNGGIYECYSSTNLAGATYADAWINPGNGYGAGATWQDSGNAAGATGPVYGGLDIQGTVQSVPEPTSIAALGLGLVGLISRKRRKA